MSGHAQRSPSAAERWMTCPGSVVLLDGVESENSEYAQEGTDAHQLAALALQSGRSASAFAEELFEREDGSTFTPDADMIQYVQVYLDEVRRRLLPGTVLLVEELVDPSDFTGSGENGGTADAVLIHATGDVEVHDLKYGQGVLVDADENKQLMLYALGALATFDYLLPDPPSGAQRMVQMVIHQPRRDHLSEFAATETELMQFADSVIAANQAVDGATANTKAIIAAGYTTNYSAVDEGVAAQFLIPSEKGCRWCEAKSFCPSLANLAHSTVFDDFEDLTVKPVDELPATALPRAGVLSLIEDWCSAMRVRINGMLASGQPVPGWKLVRGRKGNRVWTDEKTVAELVTKMRSVKKDDAFTSKLKSPAQLETVVPKDKWKKFAEFVEQGEGSLKAVDESDKGEAVDMGSVADEFQST